MRRGQVGVDGWLDVEGADGSDHASEAVMCVQRSIWLRVSDRLGWWGSGLFGCILALIAEVCGQAAGPAPAELVVEKGMHRNIVGLQYYCFGSTKVSGLPGGLQCQWAQSAEGLPRRAGSRATTANVFVETCRVKGSVRGACWCCSTLQHQGGFRLSAGYMPCWGAAVWIVRWLSVLLPALQ